MSQPGPTLELQKLAAAIGADVGRLQAGSVLTGTGRPDRPDTTGGIITGSEPDGTAYRSTNGASVGAWLWVKRGGSWEVVEGDTGWRSLRSTALSSGYLVIRRIGGMNYVSGTGGRWGTVELSSSAPTKYSDRLYPLTDRYGLPEGWRTPVAVVGQITADGYDHAAYLVVSSDNDGNYINLRGIGNTRTLLRMPMLCYPASDPWPRRLPGRAVSLDGRETGG